MSSPSFVFASLLALSVGQAGCNPLVLGLAAAAQYWNRELPSRPGVAV
jgi:hypothetical protein